ncbi:FtsW/RodA/SpoVE family cell cycle protein [Flavobacteriaceae bacterium]|nr:FtsW/RodA/SpoVE family cell cycle protein [Flavobacteriaceae bacterium]
MFVNQYKFNRQNINIFRSWWLDIDKVNLCIIIFMIAFGVVLSASSSPAVAIKLGLEKTFFLKKHLIFAILAIIVIFITSSLRSQDIKTIAIFGIIIFIGLLIFTILFSQSSKGAKRWISIFNFTLQPSEFIKPLFVLVNAIIFAKLDQAKFYLKYSISTVLYLIIVCLLLLQPDFGMSVVFTFLWGCQLFAYGIPNIALAIIISFGLLGATYVYNSMPHVANRIHKFINIDKKNYQLEKSLDGYIEGSFLGKGPAQGEVKNFIPDAHTDFIMPVISEEFGVLFCIFILLCFFIIATRVFKKIFHQKDIFTYLSCLGLISIISVQIIINVGVTLGLLPTKGMTFPFISYGGSSMLAMAFCFGVILLLTKEKYDQPIKNEKILDI